MLLNLKIIKHIIVHLLDTSYLRASARLARTLFRSRLGFTINKKPIELSIGFLLAEDETRTRDSLLGRQVLYQLSYFRIYYLIFTFHSVGRVHFLNFRSAMPHRATELLPHLLFNFHFSLSW